MKLINCPSMPTEIKAFACHPGNTKKTTYKYVYDEKYGCPRRVPTGSLDLQGIIQQSADDIDFKSIGRMLVDQRENVISHFDADGVRVVDTTLLPRNIHEYEALHNKMKSSFDGLPDDIKALFGNDFDSFKTAYLNGTMKATFDTYVKSKQPLQDDKEGDK